MGEDAFPDVRWGRDPGRLLRRSIASFVGSKVGSWCVRKLTPVDRWLLSRSSGRFTMGGKEIPVVATQVTGPEHDRIFRKFADYVGNYDAYRDRTDRELRVFALARR